MGALAPGLRAQYTAPCTNYLPTYFQRYNATPDTLFVKGSSVMGALSEHLTYPVEVRAERISNPQATNTLYAVSVRTTLPDHVQVDYIDYDELDAVIRGVQYISQANSTVTPMDNFEAVVRTRGGLSIAKLGRGPKVTIAMTCGGAATNRNLLEPYVLDTFARTLTEAKAKIDLVIASGQ